MTALPLDTIDLVSLLAESDDPFYAALADWLCARGVPIVFDPSLAWEGRSDLVSRNGPLLVAMCGGLFVRRASSDHLEALVTPSRSSERHRGAPIFFSDVIVHRDSSAVTLESLRGKALAVNDVLSLSGYDALRDHLRRRGELRGFFGAVMSTGSHARSMKLVSSKIVDAAAIDSGVLESARSQTPELVDDLRVVESLGPFANHPIAVSAGLAPRTKERLRELLVHAHDDESGRRVLALGGFARCTSADAAHYEPIRHLVSDVRLVPLVDSQSADQQQGTP
jgi:ABC-type phosphate/phosphonate transport system substrate-binding protein